MSSDRSVEELENDRDVDGLIATLVDHWKDEGVRCDAALSLGRLEAVAVLDKLIGLIINLDFRSRVRRCVKEAISVFPAEELALALTQLLTSAKRIETIAQVIRSQSPGLDVAQEIRRQLSLLLEKRAHLCSSNTLDVLTVLADQEVRVPVYVSGDVVGYGVAPLDCSQIRTLAIRELEGRPDWVAERDSSDPPSS